MLSWIGRSARPYGAAVILLRVWFGACGATAESVPDAARLLVVVAKSVDLPCVRRIAGEVAEVQSLFPGEREDEAYDYDAWNAHALQIRKYNLLLAHRGSTCLREALWCERLVNVNPSGSLTRLHPRGTYTSGFHEFAVRRAREIHQALVIIAPHHRSALDANLSAELTRLRREDLLREVAKLAEQRRFDYLLIGIDMDQPLIESALIDCLLTNEEMSLGPDRWSELDDPFPVAPRHEDMAADENPLSGKTE